MTMLRSGAVAVAAWLLAGCLAGTAIHEPRGPVEPWAEVAGDPWYVSMTPCGFCAGDANESDHHAFALWPSGEVLFLRYGLEAGPFEVRGDGHPDAAVGVVSQWHDAIVHIHDAFTATLDGTDQARVLRTMETSVRHARDPGPPDFSDIMDYGGHFVRVDRWDVHLNASDHEDDAWGTLLAQEAALRAWLIA